MLRLRTLALAACLVGSACSHVALAQVNERVGGSLLQGGPRKTLVEIILIATSDGGAQHAQDWRPVFEKLNIDLRIRQPLLDDKPEVKETQLGRLRQVTAIGVLDRNGDLTFPTRKFSRADGEKLVEWINELKAYGAQGTPKGKPLWGLSQEQFELVLQKLSAAAPPGLEGESLSTVIGRMEFPDDLPVRFSTAGEEAVRRLPVETLTLRQKVDGFTVATALAIALNDCGLGFRPNRTPAGTLELVIDAQRDGELWWPVGWPLEQSRPKAAPKLFVISPIVVENQPLEKVLAEVAAKVELPLLYDWPALKQEEIDPAKVRVTHARKRQAWMAVLPNLAFQGKLKVTLWQDEVGKPFLWVTTLKSKRTLPTDDEP